MMKVDGTQKCAKGHHGVQLGLGQLALARRNQPKRAVMVFGRDPWKGRI